METKDLILLMMIPAMLAGIIFYTEKGTSIAGYATAQQEQNNIIGAYSIMPSFRAKIDYDLNDYNKLNGLLKNILTCYESSGDIGSCIQQAQNQDESFEWIIGCDKGAEKILYDFAEFYQDCADSDDTSCVCRKNLDVPKQDIQEYGIDNHYKMNLNEDRLNKKIEIKMTEPDAGLSYSINSNNLAGWFPKSIDLGYSKDKLSDLVMIFREEITGQSDPYSLGQPLSEIVIYRNNNNPQKIMSLDFVRISTASIIYPKADRTIRKPDDLHDCRLKPKQFFRFCAAKKGSKTVAYSKSDNEFKERGITYKFAVTFPEYKPIEIKQTDGKVMLSWKKPAKNAGSIKGFNLYTKANFFLPAELSVIDSSYTKKYLAVSEASCDNIRLNCEYTLEGLEKGKLYNIILFAVDESMQEITDSRINAEVIISNS